MKCLIAAWPTLREKKSLALWAHPQLASNDPGRHEMSVQC